MKHLIILLLVLQTQQSMGQSTNLQIQLDDVWGDAYKYVRVTLKNTETGQIQTALTTNTGIARFMVSKDGPYEIKPENYYKCFTEYINIKSTTTQFLNYAYQATKNNIELKYKLALPQLRELENIKLNLIDSTKTLKPNASNEMYYARLNVSISYASKPIVKEKLFFNLKRLKKTITYETDSLGKTIVYLPLGDTITLNFKYDKAYSSYYYFPSKLEHITDLEINYIGSVALEKIAREKEERMKREKERIEKLKIAFEEMLKKERISKVEAYKSEYKKNSNSKLFSSIFKRHDWKRKLIVCDVTGSMSPYVSELLLWLKLNYEHEKNAQFVFFNDGDNMADENKKPGQTGGVYFIKPNSYTELLNFAAMVSAKGYGGDAPENNIEALMKAIKSAKDYDEIIMVADSRAAINDLAIIDNINKPVRTILCGIEDHSFIEPDYLLLAWKTKGSIHTIESDIENIAKLMEGQSISYFGNKYTLQNGRFIPTKNL